MTTIDFFPYYIYNMKICTIWKQWYAGNFKLVSQFYLAFNHRNISVNSVPEIQIHQLEHGKMTEVGSGASATDFWLTCGSVKLRLLSIILLSSFLQHSDSNTSDVKPVLD